MIKEIDAPQAQGVNPAVKLPEAMGGYLRPAVAAVTLQEYLLSFQVEPEAVIPPGAP
ncbi:hypothetical protein [Moorella sp. Hama-1]|uniref:hypothetical protein n=1 Tax=Moorella sp. Hama-1 TaxID=2138101 RepID=UPI00137974FE|nr:hypothetical protein [Moorella sp. Hama-1]BCV21247.1 hypothetical protein hamaS1_13160 [Moorella sp. Hama-1]